MLLRSCVFCFVFVITVCCVVGVQVKLGQKRPSLAITMICRDEEVNFKANLAKWTQIVDFFVFLIDRRTTDGSVATIERILNKANKKFKIVEYDFTGFGPARTQSLNESWNTFPQASHVMIADPDWSPDVSTMNIYDLDDSADVFRFTAFDRNGVTKRRMDWMLKHREGLSMRYHLHEVLSIGMYSVKNTNWVVHEIERPGSWHTTVGHENSFSASRFLFDLDLLYKDLAIYGHDPHCHYYLGITHEAYASKIVKTVGPHNALVMEHTEKAVHFLQLRATSVYDDEFVEQRWAVMMQLGTVYMTLQVSFCFSWAGFNFYSIAQGLFIFFVTLLITTAQSTQEHLLVKHVQRLQS